MFKPQFAQLVELDLKLQTVRPKPERMPKPGDKLSLRAWTGKPYRSKQRVLKETVVASVEPITIDAGMLKRGVVVWIYTARSHAMNRFARADGFANWQDLSAWFQAQHGLPFEGILIKWLPMVSQGATP